MGESKTVLLRVPENLFQKSIKTAEDLGFKNIQEFIRDRLREATLSQKQREAIARLRANLGATKGKARYLTQEEREKALDDFLKNKPNLFRKYGLD